MISFAAVISHGQGVKFPLHKVQVPLIRFYQQIPAEHFLRGSLPMLSGLQMPNYWNALWLVSYVMC